jgi:hypothetical protein
VKKKSNSVDLTPQPTALVESLRSIGYSLETALADIIDNSVTAGSHTISVRFMWNHQDPWIAVADDGCGMNQKELIEAMRFGSRSPRETRDADDLGRFGLGMKTASISQCRSLTVISKKEKRLIGCTLNLDKMKEGWSAQILDAKSISREDKLRVLSKELLAQSVSGTIVIWRNLDAILADPAAGSSERTFSSAIHKARIHMETVFHRYLSAGRGIASICINFNKSKLSAFDPFGPKSLARQELVSETITVEDQGIKVQPYVLPHPNKVSAAKYKKYAGPEGYLQNQGFYVYRNRRLIVKSTWFRLIKKDELNKLIRVRVDIPNTLDHLWKIDVKKSSATPPQPVLRELKRIINKIAGSGRRVYTKRASTLREKEITPVWKRVVSEGKIQYQLNEKHPLLAELIAEMNKKQGPKLNLCLKLISNSFPKEIYYADVANDEVDLDYGPKETEVIEAITQLKRALEKAGVKGDKLKDTLFKTEIPGASSELIDRLMNEGAQ